MKQHLSNVKLSHNYAFNKQNPEFLMPANHNNYMLYCIFFLRFTPKKYLNTMTELIGDIFFVFFLYNNKLTFCIYLHLKHFDILKQNTQSADEINYNFIKGLTTLFGQWIKIQKRER